MALPPMRSGTSEPRLRAQPLSDLLIKQFGPFPEWIGPRILPKRGTLLFGGQAKIGKSMLMLSLARALALGESPLTDPGMYTPSPCKVLMIEQELGEYGLQERSVPIFAGSDPQLLEANLFYISKEPSLQLDMEAGVRAISGLLEQTGANVLIMDPISWMHGYDENSNTHIAKLFHTFEEIKKKFVHNDLSIIISHHFGKPNHDPKFMENHDELDSYNFRGAGKWKDAPDTLVTLVREHTRYTPHENWELNSRWLTRHGSSLPDRRYTVNLNNDLRVYHKPERARLQKGDAKPSLDERMKPRRQFL